MDMSLGHFVGRAQLKSSAAHGRAVMLSVLREEVLARLQNGGF